MHYRSFADMSRTIQSKATLLPADVDLVVGIPRSGLFPASMISLLRNLPLADIDGYAAGRLLSAGATRRNASFDHDAASFRKVLVVDDSIFSGEAMNAAREKLRARAAEAELIFCAIYADADRHKDADVVLEAVPTPRMFQWNLFHHALLAKTCFDLDGLLLPPPGVAGDFDAVTPSPVCAPTRPVAHLVTAHPATSRPAIEARLRRFGVRYGVLSTREPTESALAFKSRIYAESDAIIMLTAEDALAAQIAQATRKPVLTLEAHTVVYPAAADRFLREMRFREDHDRVRSRAEREHRLRRRVRHALRKLRSWGLPLAR